MSFEEGGGRVGLNDAPEPEVETCVRACEMVIASIAWSPNARMETAWCSARAMDGVLSGL